MNHQQLAGLASDAAKAAPPITVTGAAFAGVGLSDVVLVLTIIYTAALLFHRIVHWRTPPGGGK